VFIRCDEEVCRMRKLVARAGVAVLGVVAVRALVGPGTHGRALLRRGGDRVASKARYLAGRWQGVSYRARGRRPDPTVSGTVLADRIRSSLGPLEARMDLPHIHVMAEEHVALLHGDVATAEQADEIEAAVAAVSGVEGVESYLHVGLLPSDTRPSDGVQQQAPSTALRQLLGAATDAGIDEQHGPAAVHAILAAFLERLPGGEREQVAAHLPADVRRLAGAPRRVGAPARQPRTVADLVARVVALDGVTAESAEPVIAAVLATLRALVPEEAADIVAVLPRDLARFWQEANAPGAHRGSGTG
jgi:uncharacterized protein (DUF2267 family)